MDNVFSDPVRRARQLSELTHHENDPARLIKISAELRLLGRPERKGVERPDLAISVLDSLISKFGPSKDSLSEKILCLQALGFLTEALEVVSDMKKLGLDEFAALALELRLALQRGGDSALRFNYGELISAVRNGDDLRQLLTIVPLHRLSHEESWRISSIGFRFQGVKALRVPIQCATSHLKHLFARSVANMCIWSCRVVTGKRDIYFSAMGKFMRLADLVDRLDPLLRRLKSGTDASNYKLFVFWFGGYPNEQLLTMYKRHCTFVPLTNGVTFRLGSSFIALLKLVGQFTEITTDYRRNNMVFLNMPPVIGFNDKEQAEIRKQLENTGVDSKKPFICFGLRDMAYYEYYGDVMKRPLAQQGKRSNTHHRCPPICTYVHFAKFWAQRGYQVVRMGLRVSEALPDNIHPLVIDYASGNRSDELDAFLLAHCWFLTAGDTGLFSGAAAFDRPSVISDLFLIQNTVYSSNKKTRNIFVPKLIRDTRENRLLTFREQIYFNHCFSYYEDCEAMGFEIVHNSPDDVIDASIELVGRLEGTWEASQEDAELQKAFHKIYPPDHIGYRSTGVVSAKFLKKYSYLLD